MTDGRQYQAINRAALTECEARLEARDREIDALRAECKRLREALRSAKSEFEKLAVPTDGIRLVDEALATPPPEGEPEEPLVCIWSGEWNQWWRPNSAGYTPDWREAGVYPISKARKILAGVGDEKKLEIVNHTPVVIGVDLAKPVGDRTVHHTLEQAHGDALAAFARLCNWYDVPGDNDDVRVPGAAEKDVETVRQALTASGVPYVPEEVRRLIDRMEKQESGLADGDFISERTFGVVDATRHWRQELERALATPSQHEQGE